MSKFDVYGREVLASDWNALADIPSIISSLAGVSVAANDLLVGSGSNALTVLAPGTNTYVLTMSGGSPVWAAAPSATPAGSNTQVQYNNSGAFGASAYFTYGSNTVTVNANGTTGVTTGIYAIGDITAARTSSTGYLYFGTSGSQSLNYDGTNYNFAGTSPVISAGPHYASTSAEPGFAMAKDGGSYYGLIQNDGSSQWSLAYGSSYTSLGTSAIMWNGSGAVGFNSSFGSNGQFLQTVGSTGPPVWVTSAAVLGFTGTAYASGPTSIGYNSYSTVMTTSQSLAAGGVYGYALFLIVAGGSNAANLNYQFTNTSSTTAALVFNINAASTIENYYCIVATTNIGMYASTTNLMRAEGTFTVNTAGTVSVQCQSSTNVASPFTVDAASYMLVWRIH
jgi:hypothetical protein